ncbi:unannotated protein [freshwater metagenome]|uniref:Unannotated protein n=1 Tax=freshwater metagenome TaxID=449393 RepID=A0A6J7LDD3_9ZZZZ
MHIEISDVGIGSNHDDRFYFLTKDVVVDADHGSLDNASHFLDAVFNLEWIDVLAATDDEIALARGDVDTATLDAAEIAGIEPATGKERFSIGRRVTPVLGHEEWAAHTDVSFAALGKFIALVVHDFHFAGWQCGPNAFGRDFEHPVGCERNK